MLTATGLVRELSDELECSRSAVYNNLNSLKRSGLIRNIVNRPVRLTPVGELVTHSLVDILKNKGV